MSRKWWSVGFAIVLGVLIAGAVFAQDVEVEQELEEQAGEQAEQP